MLSQIKTEKFILEINRNDLNRASFFVNTHALSLSLFCPLFDKL